MGIKNYISKKAPGHTVIQGEGGKDAFKSGAVKNQLGKNPKRLG